MSRELVGVTMVVDWNIWVEVIMLIVGDCILEVVARETIGLYELYESWSMTLDSLVAVSMIFFNPEE